MKNREALQQKHDRSIDGVARYIVSRVLDYLRSEEIYRLDREVLWQVLVLILDRRYAEAGHLFWKQGFLVVEEDEYATPCLVAGFFGGRLRQPTCLHPAGREIFKSTGRKIDVMRSLVLCRLVVHCFATR